MSKNGKDKLNDENNEKEALQPDYMPVQTSDNEGKKYITGVNLLRFCVLILCLVSLHNTFQGLREYVFKDTPIIAFTLSLVFQSIIAVYSLQHRLINDSIDETYEKYNNKNNIGYAEKKSKKLKRLVLLIYIVSLIMSILFDYVFIANSTYAVTSNADTMNGVTSEFTNLKNKIMEWFMPYYNEKSNDVYNAINKMRSDTEDVGNSKYPSDKGWTEYWNNERNIYSKDSEDNISTVYAISENIRKGAGRSENSINALAEYDIDRIISDVIETVTLLKPSGITEDEIDNILTIIDNSKQDISNLIKYEKLYTEQFNEIQSNLNNTVGTIPTIKDENESQDGIRGDIFAKMAIQAIIACERDRAIVNYEYDEDVNWRRAIEETEEEIGIELSRKRITYCNSALASLERYRVYIECIKSDPRYNISVLISEISSAEPTTTDIIDEITSKIGQGVFSSDRGDIASEVSDFEDMKKKLTEFVPIKNIYVMLNNISFMSEVDDESEKETEEQQNDMAYIPEGETPASTPPDDLNSEYIKATEVEPGEITPEPKETPQPEESDLDNFDVAGAKRQLDSLIENLAMLNYLYNENTSDITDNSDENEMHLTSEISNEALALNQPTKDQEAIYDLLKIEDKYLNKKNIMVKAFRYLIHSKDENVNYTSGWLAFFALLFAIFVDLFNLVLGSAINHIESRKSNDSD